MSAIKAALTQIFTPMTFSRDHEQFINQQIARTSVIGPSLTGTIPENLPTDHHIRRPLPGRKYQLALRAPLGSMNSVQTFPGGPAPPPQRRARPRGASCLPECQLVSLAGLLRGQIGPNSK